MRLSKGRSSQELDAMWKGQVSVIQLSFVCVCIHVYENACIDVCMQRIKANWTYPEEQPDFKMESLA